MRMFSGRLNLCANGDSILRMHVMKKVKDEEGL